MVMIVHQSLFNALCFFLSFCFANIPKVSETVGLPLIFNLSNTIFAAVNKHYLYLCEYAEPIMYLNSRSPSIRAIH